ncbi:MAG: cardiolipin synthase [Betaproteobacteria bacterium]
MPTIGCTQSTRSKWLNVMITTMSIFLVGLTGCAALPQVNVNTVSGPVAPVKMVGARGPLSNAQSKAILARLNRGSEETGIFERHLALEEAIAGNPLVVSNRTTLLQDGEATYAAMFKAIAAAKDSINLETYIIEDDEIGKKFSDALIAQQQRGVTVALLYDSVGSLRTPREFFKRLTDAGIKVVEFNPVNPMDLKKGWQINQRDHRKLLIVDGKSAFLGGVNISNVYSSGSTLGRSSDDQNSAKTPWRDTHLLVEGPVVAEFQKLFLETWKKQKGEPLPDRKYFPDPVQKGREVVRAIGSSSDEGGGQIYNTLVSAINSAETSIYLTNAYFAPDETLMNALKEAVKRSVDVKIILPSKTDSGLIFNAGRSYYGELLSAGIEIYERTDALLHAKTALIDGVWSTIGSTNLDWRSFLHNDEINAIVLSPEFGAQMNTMFEKDLVASNRITVEAWGSRPLAQRIKEQAARMWVYWL